MRKLCTGKDNLCGYCDVKNCISDAMYLSADGYIYANSFLSYETMRMKEHKLSMGKITEKDLYSMVTQWNNECDSATKEPMWMKMNDIRGCRLVDCIDLIISMIDYIKENKFEVVEELYKIFLKKYQLILNEKDLYNSKNHKKSLREIEENKIMIEKTINRNKTANLIMDIWSSFVHIKGSETSGKKEE